MWEEQVHRLCDYLADMSAAESAVLLAYTCGFILGRIDKDAPNLKEIIAAHQRIIEDACIDAINA